MTPNCRVCVDLVLKHEGLWTDNPRDPGGATMKGVTLATYSKFLGRQATKDELRNIPDEHLYAIYENEFYKAVKGDSLPLPLAMVTMDAGVMSGPGRSAKWLQDALGVPADGAIGQGTIAAAQACDLKSTVNSACDIRLAFLKDLSTWPTFGGGWATRVEDARAQALAAI